MSITYSGDVVNTRIWTFIMILLKWRGSLIRSLWLEAIVFIIMYEFIAINYHYVFTKMRFPVINATIKNVILQFQGKGTITVALVLGFYVSLIQSRWFKQQSFIPWTDDIAIMISAFISGNNNRAVLIRRTIMRYINVSYIIAGRDVFDDIKKQFPDDQQFIKAGLLNEDEVDKLNKVDTTYCRYFIPLTWSLKLISMAKREKLISSDRTYDRLVDRVTDFRGQLGSLWMIDQASVPLCYAQIAGLSVYGFVLGVLMGYQNLELDYVKESNIFKILVVTFPPFELFIFIFYVGWYKIAETLTNPYGQTAYNFDVIYSVQHNIQMSFLIVDQLHNVSPPLLEEVLIQYIESDKILMSDEANPFLGSLINIDEIETSDKD